MNYLAIDIGGSAIKAGIISSEGVVLSKMVQSTPMTCYEDLLDSLTTIVKWAKTLVEIKGIALSQPCVTDQKTGQALSEGALIYITEKNPAKDLGEKFGLPYAAENDGNCAALAEIWVGNGKHVNNLALVVCGTGIGGSVIIDKNIVSGKRNFAGEFGMSIMSEDENGRPLNWSELGSTLALVLRYAKRTKTDPSTLNGKKIFELAEAGDQEAQYCIHHFFRIFAYGVHNIQHVYDPDLILIGGAISERPDFVAHIEDALDVLYSQMLGLMSRPTVGVCGSGNDANLIGAVYHLLHKQV
ncbi:MAG TPA: ROK family protein [Clostridiales bacterium UBA8960]|nr:ROK family protein [Clostridiales bacterium UBA8960]